MPGRANHSVLEAVPGIWETALLKGILDEGWGAELDCAGIVPSEDREDVEGYALSSDRWNIGQCLMNLNVTVMNEYQ
ncbi:MAG: hypothetical protein AB4050_17260 [Synechococcus sp.]